MLSRIGPAFISGACIIGPGSVTVMSKTGSMYGYCMRTDLLLDGTVIASGRDYFGVARNVWSIGIAGGHPVAFTASHVKSIRR